MTTRRISLGRGAVSMMADGMSFTGLVATFASTIILGVAFGLVVAEAW
ncbi:MULTISPECIES: hypothetical protein [Nocardiaceae]|nr:MULTISPECIES: hypothetical protein [Rhodococcus]MDP9639795.1 hypothetical protein [Rhodococcus cercidiphylli]MBJ7325002.1 hypothetical protein [Rhodococcus sp. (in: high G+C Gram-positive bacteria)]MBY3795546.1 hypothetical protein [Rhodococcus fascians]MBY3828208.1 hypothetical protein [Rhodococcus fascians]MBY3838398.1 hypothetical protein [Rhodococcus fascians]